MMVIFKSFILLLIACFSGLLMLSSRNVLVVLVTTVTGILALYLVGR